MTTHTLDTAAAPATSRPRRRAGLAAPLIAAAIGVVLAVALVLLLVSAMSLEITPAAVGM